MGNQSSQNQGKISLQTRWPHLQDLSPLQDSYNICRLSGSVVYFVLGHLSSRALAAPLITGVEPFVKFW